MYLKFQIKVPAIIENIIVYFLLRYRKKYYGVAFRKIKLGRRQPVGQTSAGQKPAEQKPGEAKPGETRPGETRPGETRPVEARSATQKCGETMFAMVSPEDFEEVNKHKWHAVNNHNETYYAIRTICSGGKKKRIMMHREIMKLPAFDFAGGKERLVIDHKDGNGLNNTRENLSVVTAAENSYNRRKCKNECSSKYKGVSREKKSNRWRAIINYKGIPIRLGFFDNEIEAAKAYDEAAKELYREYAKLNFG